MITCIRVENDMDVICIRLTSVSKVFTMSENGLTYLIKSEFSV